MKKFFETPELTVLKFAVENIMTVSSEFETDPDEINNDGDIRLPGQQFGS